MVDVKRAEVEAAVEAGNLDEAEQILNDNREMSGEDRQICQEQINQARSQGPDPAPEVDEDTDLESLTVPQLKALADSRGVEIPSDAKKADIIEALEDAED